MLNQFSSESDISYEKSFDDMFKLTRSKLTRKKLEKVFKKIPEADFKSTASKDIMIIKGKNGKLSDFLKGLDSVNGGISKKEMKSLVEEAKDSSMKNLVAKIEINRKRPIVKVEIKGKLIDESGDSLDLDLDMTTKTAKNETSIKKPSEANTIEDLENAFMNSFDTGSINGGGSNATEGPSSL